jgi:nucleoid DNA-binding protein
MKRVSKNKIVDNIYNRLNGEIPKIVIKDSVNIILSHLCDKIEDNEVFTVENFGSFISYVYHGHRGVNIYTGDEQYIKPFLHVKFIPHENFAKLINQKKTQFKKKR